MGNINVSDETLEALKDLAKQDDRKIAGTVNRLAKEEIRFRETEEYKTFRNRRNEVR